MEWFWQLIDHFQKSVAGSALQSFSPIDWFCLFAIFWGLVQGSRKGFSDMFGKLLGIFLVSMLTLSFYPTGAVYLNANLPVLSVKVAEPLIQKIRNQPYGTIVVASGTSCRQQIQHLTPVKIRHMAEVLADALA